MTNLPPIPSNAFSGAAVKLNNNEIDKFLLQNTYAKNAARNFAAQKFLEQSTRAVMNQGNGIDANKVDDNGNPSPKGRSDLDDFGDAVKEWHDYSIAHARELSNPAHPNYYDSQSEKEQLYNKAISIARASKEKVANLKAVADRQKEMEAKGMSFTDDMLNSLPKAHARISSESYQPIDLTHVSANPKPWSQTEDASFSGEINKIKRTPGNPTTKQDANAGTQTTTYDNKFDPLSLNRMYTQGATKYEGHAGFKDMIDNIIKDQGQTYQSLKGIYKSEFGTEATHPEDIAAAYALSKNGDVGIAAKTSPLSSYSDAAQQKKLQVAGVQAGITLNREKQLSDYNRDQKQKEEAAKLPDTEGLLQGIENNAKTKKISTYSVNGQPQQGYMVEHNPKIAAQLAIEEKGHKVEPDQIFVGKDGNYTGVWLQKDESGKPVGSADNKAVSVSRPPKTLSRETIKNGLNQAYLPKKEAGAALPKPATGKKKVSGF